jgi:autoinducer 2-degrading protein
MSNVVLSGFIKVPPDDLVAIIAALPQHIELTRAESGCLRFEVTPHTVDSTRFEIDEVFVDPAAFRHHQQRVTHSAWGKCTQNVERNYEIKGLND